VPDLDVSTPSAQSLLVQAATTYHARIEANCESDRLLSLSLPRRTLRTSRVKPLGSFFAETTARGSVRSKEPLQVASGLILYSLLLAVPGVYSNSHASIVFGSGTE
jgi:hypothetical protein